MAVRIEFTVPDDMHERLEAARGHEARASFIKRTLERALYGPTASSGWRAQSASPSGAIASAIGAGRCRDCGKANGVHRGDCPQHPRAGR